MPKEADALHPLTSQTCIRLREVYASSSQLQYEYTLRVRGYLDVPFPSRPPPRRQASIEGSADEADEDPTFEPSRAPTQLESTLTPAVMVDKARALAERERRWETLDAAEIRHLSTPGPAGVYELQEGVFLMCDDYVETAERRVSRASFAPFRLTHQPTSIRLIPLPSASDPDVTNPPRVKRTHKLPYSIADLTMDPTQDLIVVSEYSSVSAAATKLKSRPDAASPAVPRPTHRFHLLTMSTFKPHPLATLPWLDFPPYMQLMMQTKQLLQVMGDVLVILVSRAATHWILAGLGVGIGNGVQVGQGNEEEVVCWNWKTGKVLAVSLGLNEAYKC